MFSCHNNNKFFNNVQNYNTGKDVDTCSISLLTTQSNYCNTATSSEILLEHRATTNNFDNSFNDLMDPNYNSNENMSRDVSVEFASIEPPNAHGNNENAIIITHKVIKGNVNMSRNAPIFNHIHNSDFLAHMEIYDILYRAKPPLYVYNLMINCIMQNMDNGAFHLNHNEYSRKTFMKTICKKYPTAVPNVINVHLDNKWNKNRGDPLNLDRDTVEIICFDLVQHLEDLFDDKTLFGDINKLVVNDSSVDSKRKWESYDKKPGVMFETLDGDWYQQYGRFMVNDTKPEFCFPIGLYIDASKTVTYQRYSFQPLIMFPLILNNATRNRKSSSRALALVSDMEASLSAVKIASRAGGNINHGTAIRNFHRVLDVTLQSLKNAQKQGGIVAYHRLGMDVQQRLIKVPVAFVLGDAKSQDQLCAWFATHNTKRMCRACHVSFKETNDVHHECVWVQPSQLTVQIRNVLDYHDNASEIQPVKKNVMKESEEYLKLYSQHICVNAFDDVDFGGFPRGIFGCTPNDMMNCFLADVLKYATRIFINGFTTRLKAEIDLLVDSIFCRDTSRPKVAIRLASILHGG